MLFCAASSDQLVSPFDSVRSSGDFADPGSQRRSMSSASHARSRPGVRCSSSSFEDARLGLKVLGEPARAAKPLDTVSSAPQSPKTPRRSGQFPYFSLDREPMDMDSLDSAWTQAGKNPICGHPR